ncbi:MAG: phosphate ABC transporter ATP-binding protein [Desulfobacterales bacterium CG07_land_8_20_14_0_80_52_14]|nr:MAG: phosphate ABC transporter ATP-binding protein [Desulfobacterales bacterium CG23_combo_of_CG06-09_8_20_14_all_52_9]PIU50676.1 MAG: phosphate ABC transporter ATP-binding protein [Desulfobacterales bacterium CG07_land_8_20_14_0_80_52_14]
MNPVSHENTKIRVTDLSFFYREREVLKKVNVGFAESKITALIGPSGAGKSTFLITLNRLWESIPEARMTGKVEIKFSGMYRDIYEKSFPLPTLRRRVGMVFQTPNPLPMSIYRNVAFPLKLAGEKDRKIISQKVEEALDRAYLWDEVKDRLNEDAINLSGGQQQRLCIARALVMEPEVLLLDEPTSSLDDSAGRVIEDLILSLKEKLTILVVSHYLEQVKRLADKSIRFSEGSVIN